MNWKDRLTRYASQQAKTGGTRQWYQVRAEAGADEADVYIYDVIDSWWGVSAQQLAEELRQISASTINVHINSPGGSAFDGLAIFQTLRNHPARIVTYVDSLAASAASFIAMAGDKRVVAPYASLMIHDAWALAVGDATVMEQARDDLNRLSDNLAAIYANRSGVGDKAHWREAMLKETWYTAQEALDAGLMQEIQEDAEKGGEPAPASNWATLAVFNFAGQRPRAEGVDIVETSGHHEPDPLPDVEIPPNPTLPDGPAPEESGAEPAETPITEPKEGPVATLSTDVLSRLGLDENADDTAVKAALDALIVKASTPVQPDPEPERDEEAEREAQRQAEEAERGQQAALAEMKAEISRLSAEVARANTEKAAAAKAALFASVLEQGKIAPSEQASWEARYDKAPDVITDILDSIAPETAVPRQPAGHAGSGAEATSLDDEYAAIVARLDGPLARKGS